MDCGVRVAGDDRQALSAAPVPPLVRYDAGESASVSLRSLGITLPLCKPTHVLAPPLACRLEVCLRLGGQQAEEASRAYADLLRADDGPPGRGDD